MKAAILLAAGSTVVFASALPAAENLSQQVWLISTRRAPTCDPARMGDTQLDYWLLGPDHNWHQADRQAFRKADHADLPTSFFIHGNRAGRNDAVGMGWRVYGYVKQQAEDRPFRFVIWSWPADRIRGRNRHDVRVKAGRSDVQSYYLAECVARIHPDVPVSAIGYSFGARVIGGALQILAGGRVAGRTLPERPTTRRAPVRAVLVAAAVDADWLLPDRRYGLALGQVDRMLVTRNLCDPVLKRYPLMYCVRGPQAIGYVGPACLEQLGPQREKIELVDLTCSVGRIHDWATYFAASGVRERLAWYALLEPVDRKTSPPASCSPEVQAASQD